MYKISEFDPTTASNEILDSYFELLDSLFLEINQEDPKPPRELLLKEVRDPYPLYENHWWLVHYEQKIVGLGHISFTKSTSPVFEQNKHIVYAFVRLHADHRGKGLGTQLTKLIVNKAIEHKDIVYLHSTTKWNSGKKFCEKLGGKLAIQHTENRLQMNEINWDLMNEWREQGKSIAKKENIHLQIFEVVPEDILEEFCKFYTEVDNQQPRGELEMQSKISPESRRLQEERYAKKNCNWYTIITREENGEISGLTEIVFIPETPYRIDQELTGVKQEFRGRGLGKWLKAEMMYYIKEKYPDVKYIRTGNADVNAPMLAINNRMGFKGFQKNYAYKFTLKELVKTIEKF
ncbi:MAG: GNAT family N-acetyltransferase [Candidatus Thorarchaeota archaeon]